MIKRQLRRAHQRINGLLNRYERYQTPTMNVALLATSETLPYCDDLIDFLFKFHLSQRTLHYYILKQIRYLVKIANTLHTENMHNNSNNSSNMSDHEMRTNNVNQQFQCSNLYLITNHHSCNLIQNDITEYTPITHEISKAIDILWKGHAITNTFEFARKHYNGRNSTGDKCNDHDNMIDGVFREYSIDIEFCEYYMNNIFDYEQEKESDKDFASTIIFNHKHWKDYKLLKRHIMNQNPKSTGLCHANCNSLIYFRMPWYVLYAAFTQVQLEIFQKQKK